MTVAELLACISSRELSEWRAYARLNPFGEERGDLQAGIVAATVANTARDPKRRPRPFRARDFMPEFRSEGQQTMEEQLQIARMYAAAGYGELRESAR
jgi:hypothetical protein